MADDPIRRASDGRQLCQECSDPIDGNELRRRTPAGVMHADCAAAVDMAGELEATEAVPW